MNGLELAEQFYLEYGAPMLQEQFPEWVSQIAVGLCGSGSECYGYDDETSRDHDFEPGFCLFLPDEEILDRQTAFRLERAYAKLPKEFRGVSRAAIDPVGGNRHGVIRIGDFFLEKTGRRDGLLSTEDWLTLPSYALAEAVNGKLFRDDSGMMTGIRAALNCMPEDIRKKKLAGNLLLMAQSGQYNYNRCLAHGEPDAAQLAVVEFVQSTMRTVFLLNRVHMPYYKWSFRAMRNLPVLSDLAETLSFLLTTDNEAKNAENKYMLIEATAEQVIDRLMDENLTKATCGDLEKHAYSVNDAISDASLRNRNILSGIQ